MSTKLAGTLTAKRLQFEYFDLKGNNLMKTIIWNKQAYNFNLQGFEQVSLAIVINILNKTIEQSIPYIKRCKILSLILDNKISMIQSNFQDEMLKSYIETVFSKYDVDHSGTLDSQEMTYFFNDLFRALNINIIVNQQQSLEAIRSIDQNSDGVVSKAELFQAFKKMMNPSQNAHQNPYQCNGQSQNNGYGYGNNSLYNSQQYRPTQSASYNNGYGYNQNLGMRYNQGYPYGQGQGYNSGYNQNFNTQGYNGYGYNPNQIQGSNTYQQANYNPYQNNPPNNYNPYR